MIVDASVAFKWLVSEEGSAAAFDLIGKAELFAPHLLLSEVANALWKKVTREQLDPAISFDDELNNLSALLIFKNEAEVIARALEMGCALRHPVYDCVYLALAEAEALTMVTADLRFARAVRDSAWAELVQILE